MPEDLYVPSEKEVANCKKVLDILADMDGIGYEVRREDVVVVREEESGISITIDAEDELICLIMEVMDVPLDKREAFYQALLELNDKSLHGAFSINDSKVFFRENLEAENLDPNELENSLTAMFIFIIKNIPGLSGFSE